MKLTGRGPEKHPLTALGELAGNLEWALFVLQTVIIAPVLEEWLFRGVILPWLAQKRPVSATSPYQVMPSQRPLLILVAAVCVGTAFTLGTDWLQRPAEVRRVFATDTAGTLAYLIPTAFFLALIPIDYVLRRLHGLRHHLRIRSPQHVRAIWASAALFAAMHAHVWPSPVPLVVLAVGLGYLYLRTRSLVGVIVVHGMFNAVSALYLLLGGKA
jgi:membrane protease YdiL (CAAX protease family)